MKKICSLNELHKVVKSEPVEKLSKTKSITPKDISCEYIGDVSVGGVLHSVYLTDWKFSSGEYGHIVPQANKIYLSRHQDPHNMLVTLCHEMLHKILEEYQLPNLLTTNNSNNMEVIVETLDKPIANDLLLSEINFKMFRRILKGEFSEEK
jgi:glyoxylate utilization-related uncharacterized protein